MISLRPRVRNTVRLAWPGGASEQASLVSIGKSGGAGEVLAIEGRPGYLAKIYHAAIAGPQLARYERKIGWMVRNKPQLPAIPAGYEGIVQLAWPVAVVMRDSRFAGFVMEKVDFERTMELDYLLTRRQAAEEGFEADFGRLVTVCCNLAALIDCLHDSRIAVVDLKPINLKVYKSELFVAILDCDGFHIHAEDFVSEAPQVTPEYLAPEFHDRAVTDPESQDRFALATIIFRLLNYGIHPFSGVSVGRGAAPSELSGRIRQGLYPYGRLRRPDTRAAPASVHECFPDSIRELFDRSFGSRAGARPAAHEWAAVLGAFATRDAATMSRCPHGHLQFAGHPCPTCLREGILRGHAERQQRFVTRLKASPAKAASYVRRSLKGTRPSPFQAALAQVQANPLRMAPVTMSIRNVLSIEILWALGLVITYWWLK